MFVVQSLALENDSEVVTGNDLSHCHAQLRCLRACGSVNDWRYAVQAQTDVRILRCPHSRSLCHGKYRQSRESTLLSSTCQQTNLVDRHNGNGRSRYLTQTMLDILCENLAQNPNEYLDGMAAFLLDCCQVRVSVSTISRPLRAVSWLGKVAHRMHDFVIWRPSSLLT